jgi:hypothetical protein
MHSRRVAQTARRIYYPLQKALCTVDDMAIPAFVKQALAT